MKNLDDLTDLETEDIHPDREVAAKRSTWVSVGVNILLTLVQVIAGALTASQGLIADGVALKCCAKSPAAVAR